MRKLCILVLIAFFIPLFVLGQYNKLTRGAGLPKGAAEHLQWHLDTVKHLAWLFDDGKWVSKRGNVTDLVAWDYWIIVYSGHHGMVYSTGGVENFNFSHLVLTPDLMAVWHKLRPGTGRDGQDIWACTSATFYGKGGIHLANHDWRRDGCQDISRRADTVLGVPAYCVHAYVNYNVATANCKEHRNWGMLGINGKWLIQPEFDAPFHFQNGIAQVAYYGKWRKINEKGEFVE